MRGLDIALGLITNIVVTVVLKGCKLPLLGLNG